MPLPSVTVETIPSRIGPVILFVVLAFQAYDHFPSGLLKPTPSTPAPAAAVQPVVDAIGRIEAAIKKAVDALAKSGPVQPPAPTPPPVAPARPVPPAPSDPESLASAATSYYRTLPATYHLVAQQVRTRQIKDEKSLRDAMGAHSLGLIAALERMLVATCDQNTGQINDPDGLAALLDGAYAAMGGQ